MKPSPPRDPGVGIRVRMSGGPGTNDPGHLTNENFSLPNLLTAAFEIQRYQLTSPNLSNTDMFMISATIPDGTTKEQFHRMLQNLLAERFGLKVHHEQKEIDEYELVGAKGSPKMALSPKTTPGAAPPSPPSGAPPRFGPPALGADGYPTLPPGRSSSTAMMNGRARMRLTNESMEKFAQSMSGQTGRPVTNKTGLDGEYDIELYWSSEGPSGNPSASLADLDPRPTLEQAIQDQLGLKLQPVKGQIDAVVVDHINKTPTEN